MVLHVPYSFVPGTKARAEEVNANFNSVLEQIDTKANCDLSNLSQEGIDTIKNNSGNRNLGEIVYSIIPQKDSCLHLLDGTKLKQSGIYAEFVEYIANLSTQYPELFISEEEWQESISNYGVCGKFVYDSEYQTLRLPKITGIVEGTTDLKALGDLVEAGLPNITGNISLMWLNVSSTASGAYSITKDSTGDLVTGSGQRTSNISFDASKSNSIYGSSTSVQPQTVKILVYITVATASKTEIQIDINNIAGDINNKADKDLSNVNISTAFKNEVISWTMPDFSQTKISIPWNTIIQLPYDAYVYHRDYSASYTDYCSTYISTDNITWHEVQFWGYTAMGSHFNCYPKGTYIRLSGGNDRSNYIGWYIKTKGVN